MKRLKIPHQSSCHNETASVQMFRKCQWHALVCNREKEAIDFNTGSYFSLVMLGWVDGRRNFSDGGILAIYATMMYTAPYVMFLMRADPLRGKMGRVRALEIETYLGPEMATSECSVVFMKKGRVIKKSILYGNSYYKKELGRPYSFAQL
jgi:hypothetical protein